MATKITEECISCGACEAECPSNSISEGDEYYVIDPETCVECVGYFDSMQCAEVCPTNACVLDPEHAETEEQLIAKAKKLNADLDVSGEFPSHYKS